MFTLIIGFVLGAVLALVGLRLLAYWNDRPLGMPHLSWRHWRQ